MALKCNNLKLFTPFTTMPNRKIIIRSRDWVKFQIAFSFLFPPIKNNNFQINEFLNEFLSCFLVRNSKSNTNIVNRICCEKKLYLSLLRNNKFALNLKCSRETLQNLPYFCNKKTHVVFFVFHFVQL